MLDVLSKLLKIPRSGCGSKQTFLIVYITGCIKKTAPPILLDLSGYARRLGYNSCGRWEYKNLCMVSESQAKQYGVSHLYSLK